MELLTSDDIAKRLKISRTHLWRLRGRGMPFIQIDRSIRYSEPEVALWISRNCTGGTCHE